VSAEGEAPAWRPVLRALIETVLAFDDPAFPAIPIEQVERRVLEQVPLDDGARAGDLRASLLAFADVEGFAALPPFVRQAERELLAGQGLGAHDGERLIAGKARLDQQRFQAFVRGFGAPHRFEAIALGARRAYLRLWARSGFAVRRRLYTTLKAIVLMAAYSLPALERAVGFAGSGA
jgi:hypothetical protein